jgi:hypothetical protein
MKDNKNNQKNAQTCQCEGCECSTLKEAWTLKSIASFLGWAVMSVF